LRTQELDLHLRLNLTHGFDKAAWPTDIAFPTLVNAFYQRQINQICKHYCYWYNYTILSRDGPDMPLGIYDYDINFYNYLEETGFGGLVVCFHSGTATHVSVH
jgi:hypothetical protein